MKTQLAACLALASLAACGGSGGGDDPVAIPDFADLDLSELDDRAEALAQEYGTEISNRDFDTGGAIPASGSAAMTGVVAIRDAGGASDSGFLGEIALSVDFAENAIEGTAGNFYLVGSDEDTTGELDFDGRILRSTGAVEGTLAGTLTVFDSATFDAELEGGFVGGDGEALAASGTDTIVVDGNEGDVEVGFIASR